jgi:predicted PurR-regulated permease PerM
MDSQKVEVYFFFLLLFAVAGLVFFVYLPFLTPLTFAATFAVVFMPLHRLVQRLLGAHDGFAAFCTVFIVLLLIFTPLFFLLAQVFSEALVLYGRLASGAAGTFAQNIPVALQQTFPQTNFSELLGGVSGYVGDFAKWLFQNIGPIFSSITQFFIHFLLMLIAFYYFLKDGDRIHAELLRLAPLSRHYTDDVCERVTAAIRSVVHGSLVVALVQGILAGIGFFFAGIPGAAFWGFVSVIASLIPFLGTALVVSPAVLYLVLIGHIPAALGLAVWGSIAVGLSDNFLRPLLMRRTVRVHSLLILLSVLGGIGVFGPTGFLLGPVVVSLLFALLDIYPHLLLGRERHPQGG